MTLEGVGRVLTAKERRLVLYVEKNLLTDSQFPLGKGQRIRIRIDPSNGTLVLSRLAD